jgi:hypothetical protein
VRVEVHPARLRRRSLLESPAGAQCITCDSTTARTFKTETVKATDVSAAVA